jgi:hypothetical protein
LISRRTGVWVPVVFTIAVGATALLLPRIPQQQSYHDFADQRWDRGIFSIDQHAIGGHTLETLGGWRCGVLDFEDD